MKTSRLNLLFFFFLLAGSLFLTSCENEDNFIPYEKSQSFNYSRTKAITALKDLPSEPFRFEIFSDWGGPFFFPDESVIEFKAGSFLLNGVPVSNKFVQVEVTLVRNKSQVVGNLLSTSSGDKLIESGGMVNVRAFCDGKELTLDPDKGYTLKLSVPGGNFNPAMELFYGEETDTGINWSEADNDPKTQNNIFLSEWTRDSSGRQVIGMECFPKKFGWVNCDFFSKLNDKPLTNPCFIPHGPSNGDTVDLQAFAVFKNYLMIIQPCCVENKDEICFGPLPIGEPVYYLIIGKGKQDYYLGYVEKNVESDEKVVINLSVKTLQEVKDFLANL